MIVRGRLLGVTPDLIAECTRRGARGAHMRHARMCVQAGAQVSHYHLQIRLLPLMLETLAIAP